MKLTNEEKQRRRRRPHRDQAHSQITNYPKLSAWLRARVLSVEIDARERARRLARDWARRRGSRSFAAVRVVQTIAPTVCAGTVYRVCSKVNEVNSFFYDTRKITYHQPKPKFIWLTLCLCRGANELRQYVHWESSPVASVWTKTLVTEASSSRNIIIIRIHINGHDDFYRDTWINFLFLPIS